MTDATGPGPGPVRPRWGPAVASLAAFLALLVLAMFILAGRIDWARGWLFVAAMLTSMASSLVFLWRKNPEIFEARRKIRPGTKGWDVSLLAILLPAMLAVFLVAALDSGRFKWSAVPAWTVGSGYAIYLAGFALGTWAQAVNPFFEPGVRIQTERRHRVMETGPYAIVRHPGYASFVLIFAGTALAVGSFWALLPAGIVATLLLLRTVWEDRTLRAELPGYAAYAEQVRFRAIPGVW